MPVLLVFSFVQLPITLFLPDIRLLFLLSASPLFPDSLSWAFVYHLIMTQMVGICLHLFVCVCTGLFHLDIYDFDDALDGHLCFYFRIFLLMFDLSETLIFPFDFLFIELFVPLY